MNSFICLLAEVATSFCKHFRLQATFFSPKKPKNRQTQRGEGEGRNKEKEGVGGGVCCAGATAAV